MRFIAKAFLAAVCLLWLVAGGVACGQPSAEAVPEERPLGTGVQAQVPNHLKLRWSKARVVSVQEKARRTRQVRVKETSGSEPLMTCRKGRDDVKTGRKLLAQEKPGRNLFTGQAASGMKVA